MGWALYRILFTLWLKVKHNYYNSFLLGENRCVVTCKLASSNRNLPIEMLFVLNFFVFNLQEKICRCISGSIWFLSSKYVAHNATKYIYSVRKEFLDEIKHEYLQISCLYMFVSFIFFFFCFFFFSLPFPFFGIFCKYHILLMKNLILYQVFLIFLMKMLVSIACN